MFGIPRSTIVDHVTGQVKSFVPRLKDLDADGKTMYRMEDEMKKGLNDSVDVSGDEREEGDGGRNVYGTWSRFEGYYGYGIPQIRSRDLLNLIYMGVLYEIVSSLSEA